MLNKLKNIINIAIIISILFNIKSILFPIRSMQVSTFVATILGRAQLYYFLIAVFLIIPISFSIEIKREKF